MLCKDTTKINTMERKCKKIYKSWYFLFIFIEKCIDLQQNGI